MGVVLVCGSGKLDINNIIDLMIKGNLTIEVNNVELDISKLNDINKELEYF